MKDFIKKSRNYFLKVFYHPQALSRSHMALELMEEVCGYLASKPADAWTDLSEILTVFIEYDLTEEETKMVLNFLQKYCLELDEGGKRVRLTRDFYKLYEKE